MTTRFPSPDDAAPVDDVSAASNAAPRPPEPTRQIEMTRDLRMMPELAGGVAHAADAARHDRDVAPADAPRVGPYQLVRELGRGGQGTVWLAEDTRLHRQVALKVLSALGPDGADQIARFRREAEVASKLDHPGICGVHDAGIDDGVPWIAMRYVVGQTLAERIAASDNTEVALKPPAAAAGSRRTADDGATRHPPRDAEQTTGSLPKVTTTRAQLHAILLIVEKAARALHAAHEAGIVHRDIKPGNIMVTDTGEPVILDFGLAHDDSDSAGPTLTHTGEVFGTPAYMSPEQLSRRMLRLDRRTDVWSLGVSLYECLTRQRPFRAHSREGLYQAILSNDHTDSRALNPSLPRDLAVVIDTALEKDRDRRYATALDFAEELRRVRCFEPIVAKPAGRVLRLRRWSQRNPALATALLALFVALVLGLTISLVLLEQARAARDAKDTALTEKQAALTGKQAALDDYERLGDVPRLQQLITEADTLWPADKSNVPAMNEWLGRARVLQANLPGHRAVLDALRASTTATSESRPDNRRAWLFSDKAVQFKHDTLAKLVDDLDAFVALPAERGGAFRLNTLTDVGMRVAFASSIEHRTVELPADRWRTAIASIADVAECPLYRGLKITPQSGLVPIARDPSSGLWEFLHLQTSSPTSHVKLPERDANGRLIFTGDTGIVFVLLPGGTFNMGAVPPAAGSDPAKLAPNVDPGAAEGEAPVHTVTLDPFFMSKCEMTQGQWLGVTGRNPSQYGPGASSHGVAYDLRHPVEQVSYDECALWMTRLGLEMPTEAQWEYAARAGTTTPFATGDSPASLEGYANLADASCRRGGAPPNWVYVPWDDHFGLHAPVATYAPNHFGLHDMAGNVFELCRDWVGSYTEPVAPGDGLRLTARDGIRPNPGSPNRINRGGSYGTDVSGARSAFRDYNVANARNSFLGLRPSRKLTTSP